MSFLLAVTDKDSGLGLDLGSRGDDGDGGRKSSPDSIVMDEGAPSSKSARDCGHVAAETQITQSSSQRNRASCSSGLGFQV
uniref:Uncharacterized protein n=1 Tax=Hordeum vulgare subsp. vulgare TaxID=112509 RepID=A0A8I6Z564_HORVV